jgi:hypothetical protein
MHFCAILSKDFGFVEAGSNLKERGDTEWIVRMAIIEVAT